MSNGKVIQIIGAVIDVEFEKDNIPNVYEALTIDGLEIILEVQQQLGDGIVRTIAMGTTEGLKRGLQAERTNAPISCLLYTSPSPRDRSLSRMPSSA